MIIDHRTALTPTLRDMLVELWVRAWTPAMPAIDFAARRDWFVGHLDGLVAGGALLLVARDDTGAPTGFLTLQPGSGAIDQIAVDARHAGRGIASTLMTEAKRLSPEGLALTVNTANDRAKRFYLHAGFVVTGEGVSARSGLPVEHMTWRGEG